MAHKKFPDKSIFEKEYYCLKSFESSLIGKLSRWCMNNYNVSKIIGFNFVVSLVDFVIFYKFIDDFLVKDIRIDSYDIVILTGFIMGLFIPTNQLYQYIKLAIINAITFGLLVGLLFMFFENYNSLITSFPDILFGVLFSLIVFGTPYFFGTLLSIIPKWVEEKVSGVVKKP